MSTNKKQPQHCFVAVAHCFTQCTNLKFKGPAPLDFYEMIFRSFQQVKLLFLSLSAMYEIFNEIDKLQQKKYKPSAEKNRLYPAFKYIQEHFVDEVITNVALAKMCNLSERRFITLFKDIYGDTPNQYILHKKISLAETLLLSKFYSTKQISEMCGFSDIYYFSKAFKKHMNATPSEYRKNF